MHLRSVLVAASALPALISGIQIPIANGVIGGASSPDDCNFKTTIGAFSNDAQTKTAGELRVVENSGVCGRATLFTTHPAVMLTICVETTPDVYQASGYGDLASGDKSIWFVLHLGGLCFF